MHTSPWLLSLQQAAVHYSTTEPGHIRRVWSGITLNLSAGEWLAVTGPNGSGKSTLASVLLGLCPLSLGELKREPHVNIRGVLQVPDAQFVGDTVEEELQYVPQASFGSQEELEQLYMEALRAVGLSVSLDRQLSSLSGGQKQLVNIAAALVSKPDVLVLDEPTAMLDPSVRKDVLHAVREAHRRGTAIVWITHRLEEAAAANRVIAFRDGSIAFDGSPREFFYGEGALGCPSSEVSPCEGLGMEPPFMIQTAKLLLRRGYRLDPLPLHAEELAEGVAALCR